MTNPSKIRITEVAFRDAHQSLLATRMKTKDMLGIAETMNKVGYWSVECWGGATFDSCIRFLKEDPWERLRLFKKAMPDTKLQMLIRGQNILGYRHYADDVVIKFVELAAKNGVDVFRIFDALNDVRNLKTAIKAVKDVGAHAQGTISYTTSPVHNIESFIILGKRLEEMGADSICIKDMAGLITPAMTRKLVKGLKSSVSIPIGLHSHSTTGMATTALYEGVKAGLDIIDTAISSLSLSTSHPPTESLVAMLEQDGIETGLDMNRLMFIAKHFKDVRKKYAEFERAGVGVDTGILISQVPGGMLSNLENQLKQQGALDKLDAVMLEIPKVRRELGYPPLVTPTSQIVGTQAVLNVLQGERYKTITAETKALLAGQYGATPAPVDKEIQKRALGDTQPITCRPADNLVNEFDKLKNEISGLALTEEDVLTYALFPDVGKKFLENRTHKELNEDTDIVEKETPVKPKILDSKGERYTVVVNGESFDVLVAEHGGLYVPDHMKTHAEATGVREDPGVLAVEAPLAGRVVKVVKIAGDAVKEGDVVMIIEAMKMETEIKASGSGVIRKIVVNEGSEFDLGATLYLIRAHA